MEIVDSKKLYGTMNTGTIKNFNLTEKDIALLEQLRQRKFNIQEELTPFEKRQIFMSHRIDFGNDFGFDGRQMFMADQDKKDGSYFEITNEYVHDNPNGWTDIPEDILLITDKVPGVVIGHPVADCPVVMLEDEKNKTAVIGHCSAAFVNSHLPEMLVEGLRSATGCKPSEIKAYISACAGPNWSYDTYPKWATDNEIWQQAITEENNIFKIDIRKAIKLQLDKQQIMEQHYNPTDTITSDDYYSNSASRTNQAKNGRHFVGVLYKSK